MSSEILKWTLACQREKFPSPSSSKEEKVFWRHRTGRKKRKAEKTECHPRELASQSHSQLTFGWRPKVETGGPHLFHSERQLGHHQLFHILGHRKKGNHNEFPVRREATDNG
jgi:hypothetical protein